MRTITLAPMLLALLLAACGARAPDSVTRAAPVASSLSRAGSAELLRLIDAEADRQSVPRSLVHRIVQRESSYRPDARNGPYWGLMQILPQTAATMGHQGPPAELLNPETNLRYAVRYLRGAWLVSGGSEDLAVGWYSRGYYYEARNRCLLVETGLRASEVVKGCR